MEKDSAPLSRSEIEFIDSVRKLRSLGWSYDKIKQECIADFDEVGASKNLVERMLRLIDKESEHD